MNSVVTNNKYQLLTPTDPRDDRAYTLSVISGRGRLTSRAGRVHCRRLQVLSIPTRVCRTAVAILLSPERSALISEDILILLKHSVRQAEGNSYGKTRLDQSRHTETHRRRSIAIPALAQRRAR